MLSRLNRYIDFNEIWYGDTLVLEEGQAIFYRDKIYVSNHRLK